MFFQSKLPRGALDFRYLARSSTNEKLGTFFSPMRKEVKVTIHVEHVLR